MFLQFQGHIIRYRTIDIVYPMETVADGRIVWKLETESGEEIEFTVRNQSDNDLILNFVEDFRDWLVEQEKQNTLIDEYLSDSEIANLLRKEIEKPGFVHTSEIGIFSTDKGYNHFIETGFNMGGHHHIPDDSVHRKNREMMDEIARNTPGYKPYQSDSAKFFRSPDWNAIKPSEL